MNNKNCPHTRTKPEQFRGGFAPSTSEIGRSITLGAFDGKRCLDCNKWIMIKRAF